MSLYYCHLATGKEPRLQFYLRQLEAESLDSVKIAIFDLQATSHDENTSSFTRISHVLSLVIWQLKKIKVKTSQLKHKVKIAVYFGLLRDQKSYMINWKE